MSLDVLTGPITGVFLPLILKSCATWPTFLKTNVTLRGDAIDLVESLKKNSPPLTVTVVAVADACRSVRADASGTSASEAIATAATSEAGPKVSFLIAETSLRIRRAGRQRTVKVPFIPASACPGTVQR